MDGFLNISASFPVPCQHRGPDRIPSLQKTVELLESFTSHPDLSSRHLTTCASLILCTRESISKSRDIGKDEKQQLFLRLRNAQDQLALQAMITGHAFILPPHENGIPEQQRHTSWKEHDKQRQKEAEKQYSYSTLKEIFIHPADYEPCVEALRRAKQPVISKDNHYLLGPREKSAFTAWFTVLKDRGKIKSVPYPIMAKLLNKTFPGLKMGKDGSTLGKVTRSSYKKYYPVFLQFIV